jgi:hypothetical protein
MNILTRTIIAAGAWLLLASTVELTNLEAAVAIVALVIYQIGGD